MSQVLEFKDIKSVDDLKRLFNMFVRNENVYVMLNHDYYIEKIVIYDNDLPRIH